MSVLSAPAKVHMPWRLRNFPNSPIEQYLPTSIPFSYSQGNHSDFICFFKNRTLFSVTDTENSMCSDAEAGICFLQCELRPPAPSLFQWDVPFTICLKKTDWKRNVPFQRYGTATTRFVQFSGCYRRGPSLRIPSLLFSSEFS